MGTFPGLPPALFVIYSLFAIVRSFSSKLTRTFPGLPLPDQRGDDWGDRLLGPGDPVEDRADDADLRELNLHQAEPDN